MDYREFRQSIEAEVAKSRKDNIELDIYLTKGTFSMLIAESIEFFSHRGDLNIVFADGRVVVISSLEKRFECSGNTLSWRVTIYGDYKYNGEIPAEKKRTYIL